MSDGAPADAPILRPGRNAWRVCRAARAAVLVDAEAYFRAFVSACGKARRSILVTGWDMDSRVCLRPGEGEPLRLGHFLDELARRTPGLEVHLLAWDYALVFARERELLPRVGFGWCTHRRVHFALDDDHPVAASHHQKVVVVDDRVAFVGGIDLCGSRWDTPAHRADDPRRRTPDGDAYDAFHDVQMAVDGECARALGDLVRERWHRARNRAPAPPGDVGGDPWPDGLAPDLTDVAVGIARTEPAHEGRPAVGEVLALHVDAIRAARRWLYVENQYLTSRAVCDALCERLAAPDGPEVVLVAPRQASGWLEEATMTALRADVVRRLRAADAHKRLLICCPTLPGEPRRCLHVHAKVTIVDDALLRVGSANLSNRSGGLDTECDLAVEARDARESEAVARVRWRLLGEHLGADPEALAASGRELGSLLAVIERHGGGERTLRPLEVDEGEVSEEVIAHATLVDPEGPLDGPRVVGALVAPPDRAPSRRRLRGAIALVAGALAVGALWAFTPLRAMLDPASLTHAVAPLRESPLAPLAVAGLFAAAGLVAFPVTALILACAAVFGGWRGALYSLAGVLASAAVTYGLGRLLGRGRVRRLAGPRLAWLIERLRRRGALSVALVRTFPVAPFTVVNVLAGAARVRLGSFLLGTALGMAPGVVALNVFGTTLAAALRSPSPVTLGLAALVAAALIAAAVVFRKWLRRSDAAGRDPVDAPP